MAKNITCKGHRNLLCTSSRLAESFSFGAASKSAMAVPRRGGLFPALIFAYIAILSASVIPSGTWGKVTQSGAILHAVQKFGESDNNQMTAILRCEAVEKVLGDMLNGGHKEKDSMIRIIRSLFKRSPSFYRRLICEFLIPLIYRISNDIFRNLSSLHNHPFLLFRLTRPEPKQPKHCHVSSA